MIDKELFKLIGGNKKYIFIVVLLQIIGLVANVTMFAMQHIKMNKSIEEFRVIAMKVLVMQLASTTIMDLVAYGGAGVGIALAICGTAFWGIKPMIDVVLRHYVINHWD